MPLNMTTAETVDWAEELALTSIMAVQFLIGVPLFLMRRHLEPIKSRVWVLVVLSATYQMFDLSFTSSEAIAPCWLLVVESLLLMPIGLYPYFIR